jgi:hypothetical protein
MVANNDNVSNYKCNNVKSMWYSEAKDVDDRRLYVEIYSKWLSMMVFNEKFEAAKSVITSFGDVDGTQKAKMRRLRIVHCQG